MVWASRLRDKAKDRIRVTAGVKRGGMEYLRWDEFTPRVDRPEIEGLIAISNERRDEAQRQNREPVVDSRFEQRVGLLSCEVTAGETNKAEHAGTEEG